MKKINVFTLSVFTLLISSPAWANPPGGGQLREIFESTEGQACQEELIAQGITRPERPERVEGRRPNQKQMEKMKVFFSGMRTCLATKDIELPEPSQRPRFGKTRRFQRRGTADSQ